ncbi:hypothetical protein [Corynebacterium sp. sy039]|nr:hypothetical protein [Corynebacterium sp. sy039]
MNARRGKTTIVVSQAPAWRAQQQEQSQEQQCLTGHRTDERRTQQ